MKSNMLIQGIHTLTSTIQLVFNEEQNESS